MNYLVWDMRDESRQTASRIRADDAYDAAIIYAENDIDGMRFGHYTNKGQPLTNISRQGRPIAVEDQNGEVRVFRVGVTDFEPLFQACESFFEGALPEEVV